MTNPLTKLIDELNQTDDPREVQSIYDETSYIYGNDSLELETISELANMRINQITRGYDEEE